MPTGFGAVCDQASFVDFFSDIRKGRRRLSLEGKVQMFLRGKVNFPHGLGVEKEDVASNIVLKKCNSVAIYLLFLCNIYVNNKTFK